MKRPQYPECAKLRMATHDMRFENIDQQAACLSGYDQRYQQVSKGKYRGWFHTVLLDEDVGLYFESFNQSLDQWGASPPDRYSFIFFMNPENCCYLGTRAFCGEDILFLPPGNGFDFRAPPETHYCVISIDRFAFEMVLRGNLGPDDVLGSAWQDTRIFRDAEYAKLLRQIVGFLVRRASQQDARDVNVGTLHGAKRSLLELAAAIVAGNVKTTENHDHGDAQATEQLALDMRDFVRARKGIGIGSTELAEEFSISRRRLEQIFQSKFEISPGAYIQTVKLNEFRSALLAPENHVLTIGDVAATFEIWHLSRLAQSYRRQFGELPSETRKSELSLKG